MWGSRDSVLDGAWDFGFLGFWVSFSCLGVLGFPGLGFGGLGQVKLVGLEVSGFNS